MAQAFPVSSQQHLAAAAMFCMEVTRFDPNWAAWSETDVSAVRSAEISTLSALDEPKFCTQLAFVFLLLRFISTVAFTATPVMSAGSFQTACVSGQAEASAVLHLT